MKRHLPLLIVLLLATVVIVAGILMTESSESPMTETGAFSEDAAVFRHEQLAEPAPDPSSGEPTLSKTSTRIRKRDASTEPRGALRERQGPTDYHDHQELIAAMYCDRGVIEHNADGSRTHRYLDEDEQLIALATCNEAGDLLRLVEDKDGDGTPEVFHHIYDDEGNQVAEEVDWAGDGVVDTRIMMTYDTRGRLVTVEREDNQRSEIVERQQYHYESPTRYRITTEYEVSGRWERITHLFDDGEVVEEQVDRDFDGLPERVHRN